MNPIHTNFRPQPVVTGKPSLSPKSPSFSTSQSVTQQSPSFADVLQNQLSQNEGVSFSKHAVQRAAQRSIDLSQPNLDRLNEGVRLAGEKGLNDTLILIDQTAFLVNVPNNKVITAVNGGDLTGNVFTNIDGTVII